MPLHIFWESAVKTMLRQRLTAVRVCDPRAARFSALFDGFAPSF
jgi:hypothetical protein